MIAGSRGARARDHARQFLIELHGWDGVTAYLDRTYGGPDGVEAACVRSGMRVVDEALEGAYPGEMATVMEEYLATHPPTEQEAWLERVYAYAETELAADLGLPVPVPDEAMERYAHEWAMLLCHAVQDVFPKPEAA